MNAFRARTARSTIAAGLGLIALAVAERPVQARQAEPLLQPTPLVLKDGRIASVSIHVVPFASGRADLGGEAAARVAELTRAVSTDCFLTAQVIGHIDSNEVAPDDTLNAHRLARSRADAVQASLIGGGLPAKAIASVWDWQFMVRAPRATLWIFQLTAGEDCEDRPLDGALVAQAPSNPRSAVQPERAATPSPERRATSTARAPAPTDAIARPAAPAPSARTKAEPEVRAEPPAATPAPTAAQSSAPAKPAERRATETAVAARPALAPKAQTTDGKIEQPASPRESAAAPAAKPEIAAVSPAPASNVEQPASQQETAAAPAAKPAAAAVSPAPARNVEQPATPRATGTVVAAKPASAASAPASDGKVESGDGSLVITFANNSSYFPAGATRRLRQLIAGLESGSRYEVSVQIAVSGSTKVVGAGSPQEAAAYNKWLAERRLERVESWLREHAAAALTFKPEYVTDESRQVVVQLAPTG